MASSTKPRGENFDVSFNAHDSHVTASLPENAPTTILYVARDPSLSLSDVQQTIIRRIVREESLAIPNQR